MALEILYHLYELTPLSKPNSRVALAPRKGALLCIDGGYASIQPWPEFGDLSLEEQLDTLKKGARTPLLDRALHYAEIDRRARMDKVSLFHGLQIPKSHRTVSDLETFIRSNPEPDTYKIKVGSELALEAFLLNTITQSADLVLRLDANANFSKEEALQFWNMLSAEVKSCVEFFEDPSPYDEVSWSELYAAGIPLAYDHYNVDASQKFYDVRVIKPVVQNCERISLQEMPDRKLVITSSMDHPLGQIIAAWEAALLHSLSPERLLTCGLLSHTIYELNEFSEALKVISGILQPPPGTGFGFDTLLEKIPWKKLM